MTSQYEIPYAPSANAVGDNNAPVTQSSSAVQTSFVNGNDQSNLASRVESLEKYVQDINQNGARLNTDVTFKNAKISDRVEANFGKIGGWDINAGVLSTPKMQIDSNNEVIKSTNYIPNVSGFKVSQDLVEAENIVARGALKGTTFSYDEISAIGGQLMVANADNLEIDMTALDSCKITTKGNTTFSANDILVMRGTSIAGIQEEWFRVTAVAGNVLTVTRDLAGIYTANENPIWKAGTPLVKQGVSDGSSTYSDGWLRLIGEGTNSPYYSVYQRTGVAYNAYTEVCRLGNLNGFLGYSTDEYGIAIGDADGSLKYDLTNGLVIADPKSFGVAPSANLRFSNDTESAVLSYTTPTKVKEILYKDASGSMTIKFDLQNVDANQTSYGQIYINGSAVGTQQIRSSADSSYGTYSENISVSTGDLIQLYQWNQPSYTGRVKNLRLYYDKTPSIITSTNNL
jgi:hypothetical protein